LETKKRIYLGLLLASVILALAGIGLIWYLFSNRDILTNILVIILAVIAALASIVLLIGISGIIIIIIRSRTVPSLENIARIACDILFPLTLLTGKILGIKRSKIQSSYIAVSNFLVTARKLHFSPDRVMILVPHCLQNSDCPHKITMTVDNCKQCGKCSIGELKELAQRYNVILKVATGGTLARRFIKQTHPQGVIAVACERDLSLGIQDTSVLPVIGVLNERPNGPCINTTVKVKNVEKALQTMCKGDD
jgi:hypothetical protein